MIHRMAVIGILQPISTSTNYSVHPTLDYDSLNQNFFATYWDTTARELPIYIYTITSPGGWARFPFDYPDIESIL
jgi:hypothetical protein